MSQPVLNDGVWWAQQADGTWVWWDEQSKQWRPYKPIPEKGVEAQWFELPGGASLPVVRKGSWSGRLFTAPREIYKPFGALTRWLVAVSITTALAYLWLGIVDWGVDQGNIDFDSFEIATTAERQFLVASTIAVLLQFVQFILMIVWTRRAYRNLEGLGVKWLRFKAGWAVGAWLVPFLNFIRPKEIINDIWRASQPDAENPGGTPSLGAPVWSRIDLWWTASMLGGLFIGPINRPIPMNAFLQVLAMGLLITILPRISETQEIRARNMRLKVPPPPPVDAGVTRGMPPPPPPPLP